jgi:hypothetical protein
MIDSIKKSILKFNSTKELQELKKAINIELKVKKKCKHKDKVEIIKDYMDAYVLEQCRDCGEKFYSDL